MEADKPEIEAAFKVFAAREMPWVLEKPEDDVERLMRTTALIAFRRGYEAATANLQPFERAT